MNMDDMPLDPESQAMNEDYDTFIAMSESPIGSKSMVQGLPHHHENDSHILNPSKMIIRPDHTYHDCGITQDSMTEDAEDEVEASFHQTQSLDEPLDLRNSCSVIMMS